MDNHGLIIGLTGSFGSGCTLVADYFTEKKGFERFSLSDIVRKEAEKQSIDSSDKKEYRENLQRIGNELRKENGPSYLAKEILSQIESQGVMQKPIVVEGFRNHHEVIEFRNFTNFYLLTIDAPINIRWERSKVDYDQDEGAFEEDDIRDREEEGKQFGQHVQKCVDLSDIVINNDRQFSSLTVKEEFFRKVEDCVKLIQKTGSRPPTDDELLMNHAYHVSLQSSCLQRKVGAVITTQDSYVLSTGFNEVPKGDETCLQKYGTCFRLKRKRGFFEKLNDCPTCKTNLSIPLICPNCKKDLEKHISPSKELDWCRAVHAEENAILQIARLGGQSLIDRKLYTTTFPCLLCAKKIVNSGISKVIYVEVYPIKEAKDLLMDCGVEIQKFEGIKAQAFYKLFKEAT